MAVTRKRFGVATRVGTALLLGSLWPATATADESRAARRAADAHEAGLPHTMVEVGAGLMALPTAEVCPTSPDNCDRGETSLALGIRNLFRTGPFGFGAGIIWATTLRADSARGEPGLERDHSRRYFLVEGMFRYFAFKTDDWEWWVGGTVGGVVINDSWSVAADRDPPEDTAFVGPRAATVGTEGVTAGIGGGAEWSFLDNWAAGVSIRYANWFLPSDPGVSAVGDVASLSGRVDMFDIGLLMGYRIAL